FCGTAIPGCLPSVPVPALTLPKTLPDQNKHSNTLRPPLRLSQSPQSSPIHSQCPEQSAAVPCSTASPTQNIPAKPPPPSQSSADAPAQSRAPRHTSRGCTPPVPRAAGSSVVDTHVLGHLGHHFQSSSV